MQIIHVGFLQIMQRHVEKQDVLYTHQLGCRAGDSMTLQCMRLAEHVTLYFGNNITDFLDIEKAFHNLASYIKFPIFIFQV
jgi:hypothetical protein